MDFSSQISGGYKAGGVCANWSNRDCHVHKRLQAYHFVEHLFYQTNKNRENIALL